MQAKVMPSMKKIISLTLALFLIIYARPFAQSASSLHGEQVYTVVEKMPEFEGGNEAMFKFIIGSTTYPLDAKYNGIQGKVYIKFMIDKEGNVQNATVMRGRYPSLDQEALRVVSAMPQWIPGAHNGRHVDVWLTLPIDFKLK
jgi:periplasmic protein TonB